MKHLFFGFLALVTTMAQANAFVGPILPANNVRLELAQIPVRNVLGQQLKTTKLQVMGNGLVFKSIFNSAGQLLSKKEVTRLSFVELEQINVQILAARRGEIVTERHQIHCMAIASHFNQYTAANGNVFLLRSQLCADPTINTSNAATVLVTKLNDLDRVSRN